MLHRLINVEAQLMSPNSLAYSSLIKCCGPYCSAANCTFSLVSLLADQCIVRTVDSLIPTAQVQYNPFTFLLPGAPFLCWFRSTLCALVLFHALFVFEMSSAWQKKAWHSTIFLFKWRKVISWSVECGVYLFVITPHPALYVQSKRVYFHHLVYSSWSTVSLC